MCWCHYCGSRLGCLDGNSNPEVITRTYSVTDAAGNSINVTQLITVDDTINPTASNLAPVNVQLCC
ncbi:MAG: hypothetical protein R2816_00725 [Flavobacteriaceae bacterium]